MTLVELDEYFRSFLKMDDFYGDPSQNGIQVQNGNPCEKQINKVAFAVDACQETISKAAKEGAGLLFVHHGIFWSSSQTLTGNHFYRTKELLDKDMALYACHLPLDANEVVGNNFGLAKRLGLENVVPFGEWRGMTIGVAGDLSEAMNVEQIASKVLSVEEKPLHILPFGKRQIKTVAIISGGAGDDVQQAVEAGYDAFITGEIGHEQYHLAQEGKINVIAGGHYQTETVGVCLVMEKLAREKNLQTVFIDVPTGL